MNLNLEFIKKRKDELGLTLDQIVEISGIPKGTLSKITAGINTNPKLETLRALAKVLKCSLDDFTYDAGTQSEEFLISDSEKLLILAYRNAPQMQDAVNRLLGLNSTQLSKVKIKNQE